MVGPSFDKFFAHFRRDVGGQLRFVKTFRFVTLFSLMLLIAYTGRLTCFAFRLLMFLQRIFQLV